MMRLILFFALASLAILPRALAEDLTQTQTSGPVTVTTTLSPSNPKIGDEVSLLIEAKAEKDVELLMPEFDEVISGFPIAEWIPKQKIESDGSTYQSIRYKFQVSLSGKKSIPPILVEFIDNRPGKPNSPDDLDAFEILTERIEFEVASVVLQGAATDLKPPLPELELETQTSSAASWLYLLLPLALLGLIPLVVMWLQRRQTVRKANAYDVAKRRLEFLIEDRRKPKPTIAIEQFFVEISGVVRKYLEDRFELRAPDLTTDEFLQVAAQEGDLSREHQNLLGEFLQQADIVKFAGVQANEDDVERSSGLALKFLEETRSNAPEIVVSETTATAPANASSTNVENESRWQPPASNQDNLVEKESHS